MQDACFHCTNQVLVKAVRQPPVDAEAELPSMSVCLQLSVYTSVWKYSQALDGEEDRDRGQRGSE